MVKQKQGSIEVKREHSPKIREIYGNERALEIVAATESKQEAVLLRGPSEPSGDTSEFHPVGQAVAVPDDLARRFRQIMLLDDSFEDPGHAVGCKPNYGLRISASSGADRVDLYFCFECTVVKVELNGERVGGGSFWPANRELLSVALRLFPDDSRLKKLAAE